MPFCGSGCYYTVNLEGSQIVANKDIHILFIIFFFSNQVYFFPFSQIKYNGNILFAIYFHSPNTKTAISASSCVCCKTVAMVRPYLMLVKAFIVLWLWLEHLMFGLQRKLKGDFGVTMIAVS